ncbi:MAG: hypothetical protein LUG98_13110 [Tannerellaceae bacterium]|nr:hypothetical protein [Tannerellaceae bacterium]
MKSTANSKAFRTEEDFQEIYSACLETQPQAPQSLRDAQKALSEAFWAYLAEYEEHIFRYAYQCGYEAGRAAEHETNK